MADQRLSLIIGDMEAHRIHKMFKEMLFLPSKTVSNAIDMGIRAERMFEEEDQQGLKALLSDVLFKYFVFLLRQKETLKLTINRKKKGNYIHSYFQMSSECEYP